MPDAPLEKPSPEELILRDYLAIDRTILANERTLLAYIRTSLGLFAVGATFLHFFPSLFLDVIGAVFLLAGAIALPIGITRYRHIKRRIDAMHASTSGRSQERAA